MALLFNSSSDLNLSSFIDEKNFTKEELAYQLADNEFQKFLLLKDSIEYPSLVVLCIVGIFGSLLTLGTMSFNKSFSEPVFICYQAIAVFEIIVAVAFGFNAFYKLWPTMRASYAWNWSEEIAVRFMLDPFRESVSIVTMFLSVGRVVAAFMPTQYYLLDRASVNYAVVFLFLLMFVALDLPHIASTTLTWNARSKTYAMSSVGTIVNVCTEIKNAVWITLSAGLLVSTVLAVAAFLKGISLRRRLFQDTSTGVLFVNEPTSHAGSPLDVVKKNLQLCYLQLCLNVPLIFYNGLFFVLKWWKDDEIAAEKRKGNFSWAYQQAWLLLFLYTAEAVAHFFHFYLYLIFSETFRIGFLERFVRK